VSRELRHQPRVFIAEYDFSKFFDNISHDYLFKILKDQRFLLTSVETAVIETFLRTRALPAMDYQDEGNLFRERGIPQGTSISLFLANVAAWELDRSLERLGVSFVRYADDTLIWSSDYTQLCGAVDRLHDIASRIGAPINLKKSKGIRLLIPEGGPAEIERTSSIDYLGHRISLSALGIRSSVVDRIQAKIRQLLYFNLIREPARGMQAPARLGQVDKDYVTYVWQLRRYLYGDISERKLRRYEAKGTPIRRFRGALSFFPLIDDEIQLGELDRWLVCATCLALRRRSALLKANGYVLPAPHGLPCGELAKFVRRSSSTGGSLDLRIPSFARISRVIRRSATQHGAGRVGRSVDYTY
jgi:hypothetical protein